MNNKKPEERLPPISQDRKDYLFCCLLRLPGLFIKARDLLKPTDMDDPQDVPYAVLWQAAHQVALNNNGSLPTQLEQARIQIEMTAKDLCRNDPDTVTSGDHEALFGGKDSTGLIAHIYAAPEAELSEQEGNRLLRRYLEEVLIYAKVQRTTSAWRHGFPSSISPFMERLNEQKARISTLSQSAKLNPLPTDLNRKPIEIFTTGVSFLDYFMAGGQSLGEVYVLMGPTGSGKTTLAVQIAVEGARYQLQTYPESPGYWYYFTYESPVEPDVQDRILSYAACIEEKSLRSMATLSTMELNNYKPYELKLFKDKFAQGELVPGEHERLVATYKELSGKNLWPVDFSGAVDGAGGGGVDEIGAFLEREQHLGHKVAGFVIDYAHIAITRHVMFRNLPNTEIYPLVARYVNEVRIKLTTKFNCCGWVLGQLHGETTKKHHSQTFHHSEALGCRNFADNAWFAFQAGNQDIESGCLQVACTKQRRAEKKQPVPVLLEGNIRRMTLADGNMALDKNTRDFVPTNFQQKVVNVGSLMKEASKKKRPSGFDNDPAIGV